MFLLRKNEYVRFKIFIKSMKNKSLTIQIKLLCSCILYCSVHKSSKMKGRIKERDRQRTTNEKREKEDHFSGNHELYIGEKYFLSDKKVKSYVPASWWCKRRWMLKST